MPTTLRRVHARPAPSRALSRGSRIGRESPPAHGRLRRDGLSPTWTCSPYQLMERPSFGDQVAWAKSNAIVFANSVLGARTGRYGDFIDISAAVTGRAPAAGLHLDAGRRARTRRPPRRRPGRLARRMTPCYPVLGHVLGRLAGSVVPVLVGLPPDTDEDRLKAVGAAAASAGSVAMFHAVGVTPEAATLEDALGRREAEFEVLVDPGFLSAAAAELSTATGDAARRGVHWYSPCFQDRTRRTGSAARWPQGADRHLRERRSRRCRSRPLRCGGPRGGRGSDGQPTPAPISPRSSTPRRGW